MIPHFHFQKITLPTYWTINHKGKRRGRKMEFIAVIQVRDSLVAQTVKTLPAMKEMRFSPWVRKIPGRRKWQPTPLFLPGESLGWRSLAGFSPWDRQESDMTEWLRIRISDSRIRDCDGDLARSATVSSKTYWDLDFVGSIYWWIGYGERRVESWIISRFFFTSAWMMELGIPKHLDQREGGWKHPLGVVSSSVLLHLLDFSPTWPSLHSKLMT